MDLSPLVSAAQRETVENYVRIGKEEGAECVLGGESINIQRNASNLFGAFRAHQLDDGIVFDVLIVGACRRF